MRGGSKFRSALRNAVSKAAGGAVRVGILETQTYPAKDGKGDVSVAQVAYWNEYGTANIPALLFSATQ